MKKSLPLIIGLVVVAAFIAFLVLGGGQTEKPSAPAGQNVGQDRPRDKVPDLTFEDYAGSSIALSQYSGKPLVINAWATWCPFCVDELPDFVKVQKEFGDQVTIIAVDRAEPRGTAKAFTDQLGISDDLLFLLDIGDTFYKAIGGFSMPETIFADRQGAVVVHKRGPMKANEIRANIQKIL